MKAMSGGLVTQGVNALKNTTTTNTPSGGKVNTTTSIDGATGE